MSVWEDLGVVGRILLKWIFNKYEGGRGGGGGRVEEWTVLVQVAASCESGNKMWGIF